MNTEFYSLQLSRYEALECLRALLMQAIVEEEVRLQKGLELAEVNPLINRLMNMLNQSEDEVESKTDRAADELWEYSWYVFTSEWAWYRAQQETLKSLRKNSDKVNLTGTIYKRAAEQNFKKFFEKYVAELNMKPLHNTKQRSAKRSNSSPSTKS